MKWKARLLLVFSIVTFAYGQTADEETAIKKLFEKESATWRAKDVTGHAESWHIQLYSRILISLPNGTIIDLPPSAMKNQTPHSMGNGGAAVNSNYKMSIRTHTPWVSHDELSTDRDGKRTWSDEIRLLEKVQGLWKLVGQSLHIYRQEK